MYINPFFAGVLCTIVTELLLFLIWSVNMTLNNLKKEENNNGKN